MKKEHHDIVEINKKTGETIAKERIEGSLIERILYYLNFGKSKEEVVRLVFEQKEDLLRLIFLTSI